MHRRHLLALAALGAVPAAGARACRLFPATGRDVYGAFQGARRVGAQRIEFARGDGSLRVTTEIEMTYRLDDRVDVAFSHRSHEVWRAGLLERIEASTEVGDAAHWLRAERGRAGLALRADGLRAEQHVSGYLVPSTLWHRDARRVRALLDVFDARVRYVHPRFYAREHHEAGGRSFDAEHWQIRGEMAREAWYGDDCRLLRVDMPVGDGSWIAFVHDRFPIRPRPPAAPAPAPGRSAA